MREIASAVDTMFAKLASLHPQHAILLKLVFPQKSETETSFAEFESDLGILKSMAESFGSAKVPRKSKDDALHHAVGGFMLLLHKIMGHLPKVRGRDSDTVIEPMLVSPEAQAIGVLLRVGQPDLLDTTLVNVIRELRRLSREELFNRFGRQLFLGLPTLLIKASGEEMSAPTE